MAGGRGKGIWGFPYAWMTIFSGEVVRGGWLSVPQTPPTLVRAGGAGSPREGACLLQSRRYMGQGGLGG